MSGLLAKKSEAVTCLLKKSEFDGIPPYLANAYTQTVDAMLNWHRDRYIKEDGFGKRGRWLWCEHCEALKLRGHTCRLEE